MSINAAFVGNVGGDAETRQAGTGTVTGFNVAVEQGYGDKKSTNWVKVDLWGSRGEKLAQYITKGNKVFVTGELTTEEYNGKLQLRVRASDVNPFLSKREGAGGGGSSSSPARQPAMTDLDDDVPFITRDGMF